MKPTRGYKMTTPEEFAKEHKTARKKEFEEKKLALMRHCNAGIDDNLKITEDEIVESRDDACILILKRAGNNGAWLVLTDHQADLWEDEALEYYIKHSILPSIQAGFREFFDNEAWKEYAREDGRGYTLASFDEWECQTIINGNDYYLYQLSNNQDRAMK